MKEEVRNFVILILVCFVVNTAIDYIWPNIQTKEVVVVKEITVDHRRKDCLASGGDSYRTYPYEGKYSERCEYKGKKIYFREIPE